MLAKAGDQRTLRALIARRVKTPWLRGGMHRRDAGKLMIHRTEVRVNEGIHPFVRMHGRLGRRWLREALSARSLSLCMHQRRGRLCGRTGHTQKWQLERARRQRIRRTPCGSQRIGQRHRGRCLARRLGWHGPELYGREGL